MTEDTQPTATNTFKLYSGYRCYITTEYYLITYNDSDFIKIMRSGGLTGDYHSEGFLLLVLEILFDLCIGRQTNIRDRWAIWKQQYEAESKDLLLGLFRSRYKVIEFKLEKLKIKIKSEDE